MPRLLAALAVVPGLVLAQVRPSPSVSAVGPDGTSTVPITAPDFRIAAQDIYIYVDSINGDDSNPGAADLPLRSFQAAIEALPGAWKGKCRIILAAGTYVLSQSYTARIGVPLPGGEPLVIQGEMADSGLGERTISSVAKISNRVYQIADNTLTPTLDQYVGYSIYFPTQNLRRIVRANSTVGVFELNMPDSASSSGPAQGQTFYIEQPGVVIQYRNDLRFSSSGGPNQVHVIFDQVKLQGTSSGVLSWDAGFSAWFQSSVIDLAAAGSNSMTLAAGARIQAGQGTNTSVSDVLKYGWYGAGLHIKTTGPNSITVGEKASMKGVFLLRGTSSTCMYFYVKGAGAYFDAMTLNASSAYIVISNGAGFSHDFLWGQKGRIYATSSTLALPGITFSIGATGVISGLDVSNNLSDGILVTDRSVVSYNNTIGSGNSGVGVSVQRGSVLIEGAGNTTTGTGGDIKVNAATTTHAAVYGGIPLTDPIGGMATN